MKLIAITKDHCPKCINAKERCADYDIEWLDSNSNVGNIYGQVYGVVVAPTFLVMENGKLSWQTTSVLKFEKFIKGEGYGN